jgi:hypothetical protein
MVGAAGRKKNLHRSAVALALKFFAIICRRAADP